MKKVIQIFLLAGLPFITLAQTRTVIATGDWDNTSTWQSGNIADALAEDVAFTAGEKTATVRTAFNYTTGSIALGNSGNLSVDGTLSIGNAANSRNLTATDGNITVSGTLTIWGDLLVTNGVTLTVSGTMIVKGDVLMGDGAIIFNSGNFSVDGDFTAGENTQAFNSTTINVAGGVTVSTSSSLANSGVFTAQYCVGPSSFCSTILPVELIYFQGRSNGHQNMLTWATATEVNFDRFIVERSFDGIYFQPVGEIAGAGQDLSVATKYSFQDKAPQSGKNYYRLKLLDIDGLFEYSKVVLVPSEGAKNITVYPSPSDGMTLTVVTNFKPSENDVMQLFDNLGTNLEEFSVSVQENKISFSDRLRPGVYLAKYVSAHHQQVIRFTVK